MNALSALLQASTGVIATEFSILYYAPPRGVAIRLFQRDFVPSHTIEKNGLLAILYTVLATAAIELAALESLLRALHHVAASLLLVCDAFAHGTARTATRVGFSVGRFEQLSHLLSRWHQRKVAN